MKHSPPTPSHKKRKPKISSHEVELNHVIAHKYVEAVGRELYDLCCPHPPPSPRHVTNQLQPHTVITISRCVLALGSHLCCVAHCHFSECASGRAFYYFFCEFVHFHKASISSPHNICRTSFVGRVAIAFAVPYTYAARRSATQLDLHSRVFVFECCLRPSPM